MDRRQLVTGLATVPLALPAGLRVAAEDWHSVETDADHIWDEIVTRIWPEIGSADAVTYGQLIAIINRLGFPVPFRTRRPSRSASSPAPCAWQAASGRIAGGSICNSSRHPDE